jgi:hypothetical protein
LSLLQPDHFSLFLFSMNRCFNHINHQSGRLFSPPCSILRRSNCPPNFMGHLDSTWILFLRPAVTIWSNKFVFISLFLPMAKVLLLFFWLWFNFVFIASLPSSYSDSHKMQIWLH